MSRVQQLSEQDGRPGQRHLEPTSDVVSTTGGRNTNHVNFHHQKTFTCADGSGTITADLQVTFRFDNNADSFNWTIISGTGAFTNLRGSGSGVGLELPGEVDDTFTGSVHFN